MGERIYEYMYRYSCDSWKYNSFCTSRNDTYIDEHFLPELDVYVTMSRQKKDLKQFFKKIVLETLIDEDIIANRSHASYPPANIEGAKHPTILNKSSNKHCVRIAKLLVLFVTSPQAFPSTQCLLSYESIQNDKILYCEQRQNRQTPWSLETSLLQTLFYQAAGTSLSRNLG